MNIFSSDQNGRFLRPPGLYKQTMLRHRRAVLLHAIVCGLMAVNFFLTNLNIEKQDAFDTALNAKKENMPEPGESLVASQIMERIEKRIEMPNLGLIRARIIFTKKRRYKDFVYSTRFDFSLGKEQVNQSTVEASTFIPLLCPTGQNLSNKLEYVDDAEMWTARSAFCARCSYPANGHIFHLPSPKMTANKWSYSVCYATLSDHVGKILQNQNAKLFEVVFISHFLNSDIYLEHSVLFEQIVDGRWELKERIEPVYFTGFMGRGNYHGTKDNATVVIFSIIVILLTVALFLDFKILNTQISKRWLVLNMFNFFTLFMIGLSIAVIILNFKEIAGFDKVFSEALQGVDKTLYKENDIQGKLRVLKQLDKFVPLSALIHIQIYRRYCTTSVYLTILVKMFFYDDYFFKQATVMIIAIRTTIAKSISPLLLLGFILLNLSMVMHYLFGDLAVYYKDPLESLFSLSRIALGDLTQHFHDLLEQWDSVNGQYVNTALIVLLQTLCINLIISYFLLILGYVREAKKQLLVLDDIKQKHEVHVGKKRNSLISRGDSTFGYSYHDKIKQWKKKSERRLKVLDEYLSSLDD